MLEDEQQMQYEVDGRPLDKNLLLLTISNGTTFGGGFKLVPDARIDDGLLSVCEVGEFPKMTRLRHFHHLSRGTHGSFAGVQMYNTSRVQVSGTDDVHAHIDGDWAGHPPFDISIEPASVQLRYAPADTKAAP